MLRILFWGHHKIRLNFNYFNGVLEIPDIFLGER